MARQPIPIGGHGKIYTKDLTPRDSEGKRIGPKSVERYEARTRWRDKDGSFRHLQQTGPSRAAAERAIESRCAELCEEIFSGRLSSTTRVRTVVEAYKDELRREAELGNLAHGTVRTYRSILDNQIMPRAGELRIGTEFTGAVAHNLVRRVQATVGYPTARSTRSVIRGLSTFAIREGLLDVNPAASIGRLVEDDDRAEPRALTRAERRQLIAGLRRVAEAHERDSMGRSLGPRAKVWADLPDVVEALLSTGVRPGELLALLGPNFFRHKKTGAPMIRVDAHIVREYGQLVRKRYRKGSKHILELQVPEWSVPMWERRKKAAQLGTMFTSASGGLIHPDNLGKRIREAFNEAGFEWLTAHGFRDTVYEVLNEAGLPTRHITDQLGHATEAITRKHYAPRFTGHPENAAALETMFDDEE